MGVRYERVWRCMPIVGAQRHEPPHRTAHDAPHQAGRSLPAHGQPMKRGLYRAADGTAINADVNGAYNIMRKTAPEAFAQGSRGCIVHLMRLAV
jgi:hypothetical protein